MFKVNSKIFLARKTSVILRYDQILLKTPVTLGKKITTATRYLWGASTDVSIDISVDISVDTRPILDLVLVEYRPIVHLMSVDVSITILYRSTIGYISVDCRSSVGRYSTDISIEYRQMHARQLKNAFFCSMYILKIAGCRSK